MHKHAPIIAIIGHGKVKVITESGENKFFDVEGGVVEVKDNKIILLAERFVK
jgi:F-type H+-transporting ATPase subunit epsilon